MTDVVSKFHQAVRGETTPDGKGNGQIGRLTWWIIGALFAVLMLLANVLLANTQAQLQRLDQEMSDRRAEASLTTAQLRALADQVQRLENKMDRLSLRIGP